MFPVKHESPSHADMERLAKSEAVARWKSLKVQLEEREKIVFFS